MRLIGFWSLLSIKKLHKKKLHKTDCLLKSLANLSLPLLIMLAANKAEKIKAIHLWLPNMFEFKGGIQTYLLDFLTVLSNESFSINLSVFDKLDSPGSQRNISEAVNFHFSGHIPTLIQTLYFSLQLFVFGLFKKPDLIICGHVNFSPVAYLLSRLRNVPYWILVYGLDAWDVSEPMQKKALREADKIVSIGTFTRDRIIQEQHIDIEKFSLLPVTFNSDRFYPSPKPAYLLDRYNIESDQPVILTVNRLCATESFRAYDQVLAALPDIRKEIPGIKYIIVGKGADRPRLEAAIRQAQLEDCVILAGFVPDECLADYYRLCDVFAMPARQEGFGIVYLEALACGKPTLGGNQDGAIDALCNGELGALVDPNNAQAIADTIVDILSKRYPLPLMYQPAALRDAVIKTYGFPTFQKQLKTLLSAANY